MMFQDFLFVTAPVRSYSSILRVLLLSAAASKRSCAAISSAGSPALEIIADAIAVRILKVIADAVAICICKPPAAPSSGSEIITDPVAVCIYIIQRASAPVPPGYGCGCRCDTAYGNCDCHDCCE